MNRYYRNGQKPCLKNSNLKKSIYRLSRENAGRSPENAAEQLNINRRTLDKYEFREIPVPANMVRDMSYLYSDPFLPHNHCREACPLGMICGVEVSESLASTATLRFVKEFRDVLHQEDVIMGIFSDDRLSDAEVPELESFLQEAVELEVALKQLKIIAIRELNKKKTTVAAVA